MACVACSFFCCQKNKAAFGCFLWKGATDVTSFAQKVGWSETYAALESADEQTLEDLASLVTVAYILECLGGVLAADIEKDFLTTGVLVYEAWGAQKWSAGGCLDKEVVVAIFFCRMAGMRGDILVQL